MVDVEPATGDDLDAIVDLWVGLVGDQRRHGTHLLAEPNRAAARDLLGQYVVADGVRVARDGDRVVGFVSFYVERGFYEREVTRGVVENVYVRPADRSQGVGGALLAAAEAELRDRGATVLGLSVMWDNDAARRFYAAHGYEPHRVTLQKPAGKSDSHSRDDG